MVLSYDYAKRNRRWRRTNAPPLWAISMAMGRLEVIHAASPVEAYPGIHRKPLDAAIGQILAPYHLSDCQGNNSKQNKDVLCTHFGGHFDGHLDAAVLCRMHRPMEEVQVFHKSH